MAQDISDHPWHRQALICEGTIAAAFELTESLITPNGVIFANYKRAGEVKTGTVGE